MTINEVDAAQVRCARLSVGLREYELEQLLGLDAGVIAAAEERRWPIPDGLDELLGEVTAIAATETVRLIERATATGEIEVFKDAAGVIAATEGRIAMEGVYRVCAGRAAMAVPQAQVIRRDIETAEHSAWLACVAAACGMGFGQVVKWFDVGRRRAQTWIAGTGAVPAGVVAEMREITTRARTHVEELAAGIDAEDPIVWVCATEEQMETHWPAHADLPLTTHQVCAARAAAGVDGARLVFLPG
ncbi:hypothetical protein AAFP35_25815 [Gordonia sp. CPCC 206044]|uniref:hypothetical protein n=1 Tax=Gordonia sp. CPCC 206044 TaxID=3140793 RepID=UPI003AF3A826